MLLPFAVGRQFQRTKPADKICFAKTVTGNRFPHGASQILIMLFEVEMCEIHIAQISMRRRHRVPHRLDRRRRRDVFTRIFADKLAQPKLQRFAIANERDIAGNLGHRGSGSK